MVDDNDLNIAINEVVNAVVDHGIDVILDRNENHIASLERDSNCRFIGNVFNFRANRDGKISSRLF